MKIFISIICFLVYVNLIYSQDWEYLHNNNEYKYSIVYNIEKISENYILSTTRGIFTSDLDFSSFEPVGFSKFEFEKVITVDAVLFAISSSQSGLFFSMDDGKNWSINPFEGKYVTDICKYGDKLFATTYQGVFSSTDEGDTWNFIGLEKQSLKNIKIVNDIYFVGTYGGGLFISKNEGNDWEQIKGNFYIIHNIIKVSDSIFISSDNGVFFSTDFGTTWRPIGLQSIDITSFSISSNFLFASYDNFLFFKNKNSDSWDNIDVEDYIYSIYADNDYFYVCTEKYLLQYNYNLQLQRKINFYTDYIKELTIFCDNIIITSSYTGMSKFYSGSKVWVNLLYSEGLTSFEMFENEFYCVNSIGFFYYSLDSGNTWKKFDYNGIGWDYFIAARNKDTLFLVNMNPEGYSGVKYSYEYKTSINIPKFYWLNTPTREVVDFKIINNIYYIGTTTLGVFYSLDFGTTWNNIGFIEDSIFKLVVDKGKLFIITKKKEIYSSNDNIQNWTKLCNSDYLINTVLNYGNDYFIGSSFGIWRYNNNGILQKVGLNDVGVNSLLIKDEYLYAGTNIGLFRAKLSDLVYVGEKEDIFEEVNIFPNPAENLVLLKEIPENATSYEIFNIFGNTVLSVEAIHELPLQINVSFLPSGIYFLKFNNQAKPIKFVKI